jgi:hypothetical protein
MGENPVETGTRVDAPLEWLAFRGLPLLPVMSVGSRIVTTCVEGGGDEMRMRWPLWRDPAGLATVGSLLRVGWHRRREERAVRGIFAICTSAIRRSTQGFGNFGPAEIET